MRTMVILSAMLTACSQVKDTDTSLETVEPSTENEPSAENEPSSEGEPSNEPSGEDTDAFDPSMMPMVNEICVNASTTEDWIEIYNPTDQDVDVSDWTFGDTETEMYPISDLHDDTIVPAGGYLVLMTKVVQEDGTELGFGLKKDGSETLFVTMFSDMWSIEVPESLGDDTSYARTPNGAFEWENGVAATPGASND